MSGWPSSVVLAVTEGPEVTCAELHPGTTCTREFLRKYENVAKNNWIFYLLLHLIPFLIFRAKKLKSKTGMERIKALLQFVKGYCGSLMFMGSFVAILKATCCSHSTFNLKRYGIFIVNSALSLFVGSFFSSCCILFEEKSRRSEVTLFSFVRSFKGYYQYLARRGIIDIPHIDKISFVAIFSGLSLLYHCYPTFLKHKYLLDKLWGEH